MFFEYKLFQDESFGTLSSRNTRSIILQSNGVLRFSCDGILVMKIIMNGKIIPELWNRLGYF